MRRLTPNPTHRMPVLLLVSAVLSFMGLGCSSDDDRALVAALRTGLDEAPPTVLLTSTQRDCVAGAAVASIGGSRLEELGVTAEDIPDLKRVPFADADLQILGRELASCLERDTVLRAVLADLYAPDRLDCLLTEIPSGFGDRTLGAVAIGLDPIAYEGFFESLVRAEEACPLS